MDVILIAMPWASVAYPSIQLGILKSLLDRSQISCASMSLNLSFFEYLAAQRDAEPMSLEQYHYIGEATGLGLGEWIFASAARSFSDAPRDDAYREFARRQNPTQGVLEIAERTRELVLEALPESSFHCGRQHNRYEACERTPAHAARGRYRFFILLRDQGESEEARDAAAA